MLVDAVSLLQGYSVSVCAEKGGYGTSSTTISTILEAVTTFVTSAISWIGSFSSTITSNPLLLVFVIVSFVPPSRTWCWSDSAYYSPVTV